MVRIFGKYFNSCIAFCDFTYEFSLPSSTTLPGLHSSSPHRIGNFRPLRALHHLRNIRYWQFLKLEARKTGLKESLFTAWKHINHGASTDSHTENQRSLTTTSRLPTHGFCLSATSTSTSTPALAYSSPAHTVCWRRQWHRWLAIVIIMGRTTRFKIGRESGRTST